MARDLYITEESNKHPLMKRFLILLLLLTLLAALAVGVYIIRAQQEVQRTTQLYEQALNDADYETAAEIYRQAQDRAISPGPLPQQAERNQQVLQQIEQLTTARIDDVIEKITRGQRLAADDLLFIEEMEEVTAVHVVQAVRHLAADFVAGDIHQRILENAFSQLAELANLSPAIGDLPDQLPAMVKASPAIHLARQHVADGDYWQARGVYLEVLSDEDLSGFVREQTSLWLEACETEMYEPLLEEAYALMEGGRYISAVEALEQLQIVFTSDTAIMTALQESRRYVPELVETRLNPEFITIRPLIIDPERAFDGDDYAQAADEAMITVSEFRAILDQLYENNYILIDSNIIYDDQRQSVPIYVPEGKKPLVLVIDGLNYYASRRETGNAWDLILDDDGQVSAVYPDDRGHLITDREGEMIGILDAFVKKNPDFSLNGAKGTIALTGYECIFGKVTDLHQLEQRNQALLDNNHQAEVLDDAEIAANRKAVSAVMERLVDTGWVFASATYGYINVSSHNLERVRDDTEKWFDRVGELTGPVSMLIYPNGSTVLDLDERAIFLREQGFILFGGQGPNKFYYQMVHKQDNKRYIHVDMTPVSGFTLRNSNSYNLERFFEVSAVYDTENRPER